MCKWVDIRVVEKQKNRNYVARQIVGRLSPHYWEQVELAMVYRLHNCRILPDTSVQFDNFSISITYYQTDAIFCDEVQKIIIEECRKLLQEPDYIGIL